MKGTSSIVVGTMLVVAFAVLLMLLLTPREYRALVASYDLTDDPRKIVLRVSLDRGDVIVGSEVREDPATITVVVRARPMGPTGGTGEIGFITVALREPVGARTVIDGTDLPGLAGHVVPREP